jgi:DNA polymerase III, delta subunit
VNALLKVVEEPPPRTKFMFTATAPPLLTIRSRCHVHRLGLLSTVQLAQVFQERLGYDEHRAYRVAQMGRGSVSGALRAEKAEGSKGVVVSALRGVAEDDSELIANALRTFDDDGLWLLRTWVREARTGRWAVYTKSEGFGLESDVRNLDIVTGMLNRAGRPRLAATLALDGWRRERGRH